MRKGESTKPTKEEAIGRRAELRAVHLIQAHLGSGDSRDREEDIIQIYQSRTRSTEEGGRPGVKQNNRPRPDSLVFFFRFDTSTSSFSGTHDVCLGRGLWKCEKWLLTSSQTYSFCWPARTGCASKRARKKGLLDWLRSNGSGRGLLLPRALAYLLSQIYGSRILSDKKNWSGRFRLLPLYQKSLQLLLPPHWSTR